MHMRRNIWLSAGLVFASSCYLGCAMVERTMPGTMSDANVLSVFNTVDRSEIEASELAKKKASSRAVRQYAQRITQEHTSSLQRKQDIASRIPMQPQPPQLASTLVQTHDKMMDNLRHTSGRDFDRAYIDYQIAMHREAIKMAEDTAKTVDELQLQRQLTQTRADLQDHLEAAETIQRSLQ